MLTSLSPPVAGAPRAGIQANNRAIGHLMPHLDSDNESPTTVTFRTIGCKLNQCETAQMQETLAASGYRLVEWDDHADIRIVNTCTVTAKSDRTCRHEIRLAKRLDPDCVVAVTGCYAQVDPGAVAAIPGVDLVLGNMEKSRLGDYLAEHAAGPSSRRRLRRAACARVDTPCPVHPCIQLPRPPRLRRGVHLPFPRLHPSLSQDPDRLRFALQLLRHPVGPRPGPQHARRGGARASPSAGVP